MPFQKKKKLNGIRKADSIARTINTTLSREDLHYLPCINTYLQQFHKIANITKQIPRRFP